MRLLVFALVALLPGVAGAAEVAGPGFGVVWGLPFAGMLASIALLPLFAERFWHRRMGLVALCWSACLLLPLALMRGAGVVLAIFWHAVLIEYIPFIALLLALYTVTGGILMRGGPGGSPAGNTLLLAIGTLLAGVMGTTGAAMVLIHPLLRANAHRERKVHIVVFFILLVANAGGATSPLGDPPLYIGFLRGVPFLWPLTHLSLPLLFVAGLLLPSFYILDRRLCAIDPPAPPRERFHLRGRANVVLLSVVVLDVLLQGVWRGPQVLILGQQVGLGRVTGIAAFLLATLVSIAITPRAVRQGNMFTWHPMNEVAKLFAALFVTIAPVMAMLDSGLSGPLAPLLRLTQDAHGVPLPLAYFWLTGLLSAFLDNAPTYLVFFELAGGDAQRLTGELNHVLAALSAGAVFFGALTYIGNAPNLMVRSIAAHRGVRMPGFFGFLLWSCALLLPVFALATLLFFR